MPYTESGIWVPPNGYEVCQWVNKGEQVIAPFKGTTGIKCTVQTAAGNHAYVVNKNHSFAKWFDVLELIRKKENV